MSETPAIKLRGLVKRYGERTVVNGVTAEVETGEDRRLARPERRRKDDDLLYGRRVGEARRRHRSACQRQSRDRSDFSPDVRARPQRHRLSRAGELDLSQTLGRRQHPAHLGTERRPARRARAPLARAARRVWSARLRRRTRRQPFRRRAPARRDRAGPGDSSPPFCFSTSRSPESIRSRSPTFRP